MAAQMTLASRLRRAVAGKTLIVLAYFGIGAPWTWIGIIPLTAGIIGWCPFQALRGRLTKTRDASCA